MSGAVLPRRDKTDTRIVQSVRNGGGRIIDSQDEVGGWQEYRSAKPPKDNDNDGMPDKWEKKHGLNPNDPSDGSQDANANGYTNLEDYLNSLVPQSRRRK